MAVVLDMFSRKVVGWALSRRINTELTLAALSRAIERRKPKAKAIHHSDQGVQQKTPSLVPRLPKPRDL